MQFLILYGSNSTETYALYYTTLFKWLVLHSPTIEQQKLDIWDHPVSEFVWTAHMA